jgi:hypothetical protein
LDVFLDGVVEGCEGAADLDLGGRLVGFEQGSEQPALELGVEHGDADPVVGEDVGVAVGKASDQPVET